MRDVFYTILFVWLIWRIFNSISGYRTQQNSPKSNPNNYNKPKDGTTTLHQTTPSPKKKFTDNEGEYVDFEEVK